MDSQGTFQDFSPLNLLEQCDTSEVNGYLQIVSGQVYWCIYFERGKMVYASHSIEPLERLERHLRRLGHKMTDILKKTYKSVQLSLSKQSEQLSRNIDYSIVCSLLNNKQLNHTQTTELNEALIKEIIETLLWLPTGSYEFSSGTIEVPLVGRFSVRPIIEYCQIRLADWQKLRPQVWSPYQRPYFFGQAHKDQEIVPEAKKITPALEQKLGILLKGFNFRELATLVNQDEIKLAQWLRPYIINGNIMLREPQPPFDLLPIIPEKRSEPGQKITTGFRSNTTTNIAISLNGTSSPAPVATVENPTYKVVCIDDSPTVLKEISRFLDEKTFSVVTISDPLKALMQVVRIKPDIILLDIGMPHINGYELCKLLRKNSLFKATPIIMVTGNTGIIDRAKAKLVGASGYLTKPFTQADLLKILFYNLE